MSLFHLISNFIVKAGEYIDYSICYDMNEQTGKAVINMCEFDDLNCMFNVKRLKE